MKSKKLYIFLMFLAALVFARLGCGIIEGLQDNKKEGEEEGKDEHKEESKIANAGNLQLINNPQPTADETATDVPASDEPATDVPTAASKARPNISSSWLI